MSRISTKMRGCGWLFVKTLSRLKEMLIKYENFQSIQSFWFIQGPLMAVLQANHPYVNRAHSIYLYCAACLTNTGE